MGNLNNWTFITMAYFISLIFIGGYITWARRECKRLEKILEAINQDHGEVTNEPI